MKKKLGLSKKLISICLSLIMTLGLVQIPAITAKAADVPYQIGFIDENGNRLYGNLTIKNIYGTRNFTLTEHNGGIINFTAESSRYYDLFFQNEDGYSSGFTFLASLDDLYKDKRNTKAYLTMVPYTVTVKYTDNTPAAGVKVRSSYDNQNVTTDANGQCTIYTSVFQDVTIEVYDGKSWSGKAVRPGSAGRKTLDMTISRRKTVPVKIMLGGQEVTNASIEATAEGDTVSGNPLGLLYGKTYNIEAKHYETVVSSGYITFTTTYSDGYSASTSYTVSETPTTITLNATLNYPKLSYYDYSTGQIAMAELNHGDSYTLENGRQLSFSVDNMISNAQYSYESSNPKVFTTNGGTIIAKGAGSATLTVRVQYGNDSKESKFTINVPKKSIAIPAADSTVYNYTGKAQTYKIADNDAYTVKNNTQTKVGTYTVTVSLKDTAQTQWSDGTVADKTYSFKINKGTPTVNAPVANEMTYTGSTQKLIAEGATNGGTLQYALGTSNVTAPTEGWSTNIPTGINAGTYYVWYKVVDDTNYNAVEASCIEASIEQAEPVAEDFNIAYADNLIYDNTGKVVSASGKDGMGVVTVNYYDENGNCLNQVPVNVGTYKVKLDVAESENYKAVAGLAMEEWKFTIEPRELTVDVVVADKKYDGLNSATITTAELKGVANGDNVSLENGTATFESVDVANEIGIIFTEFVLLGDKNVLKNYRLTQPTGITADITNDWQPTEYTVSLPNENGWLNADFAVTANEGYELSHTNTADGVWSETLSDAVEGADSSMTFYVRNKADGTISLAKTENYKLDKNTESTGTTGRVYLDERNSWETFLNNLSFGLFYKAEVTVQTEVEDKLSGVASIEYVASDKTMILEEVKEITDWTVMPEDGVAVTLEDAKQFIYYVRVTDNAGNVTYLSTDGAEYDVSAPVIEGVENGSTYYTTQTVTITDKNIEKITLNGEDASEIITLEGNQDATYTIVATDKAGNTTTVTVSMKPVSVIGTPIDGITEDEVESTDKDTIQDVIDQVDELLADEKLTEDEKQDLEEIKSEAKKLIEKIEEDAKADAEKTEDIEETEDHFQNNISKDDEETASKDDEGTVSKEDEEAVSKDDEETVSKDDEETVSKDDEENHEDVDDSVSNNDEKYLGAKEEEKVVPAEINEPANKAAMKTGDNSNILLWLVIGCISGSLALAFGIIEKKRKA